MFPEAENTFPSDFCSLSGCHSVCLEPQNSQSEAARLSCLSCKIDYIEGFLLVSANQQARQNKEISHILLNVNNIHKKQQNNK